MWVWLCSLESQLWRYDWVSDDWNGTIGWYGCFACCLLESLFLGLSMSVGLVDIGRHVDWTKSVQ